MGNPKVDALRATYHAKDWPAMDKALQAMSPSELASYLKAALLYPMRAPELWEVIARVDPNLQMYGGAVIVNAASHATFVSTEATGAHRVALGSMLMRGGNPNAEFNPAESGAYAQPLTLFSQAILSQVMEPVAFSSLPELLATMCRKGLTLEATPTEPSKLEQLTRALAPEFLLEKRKFNLRQKAANEAAAKSWAERVHRSSDPIEVVEQQAKELMDVLVAAGASPEAPFSGEAGGPAANVCGMLWSYYAVIEHMRREPETIKQTLAARDAEAGPYLDFVTDRKSMEKAAQCYAALASYIDRQYMHGTGEVPAHIMDSLLVRPSGKNSLGLGG